MTSRITTTTLAIALGAGLASAFLFASLIGGGPLALPLFVLCSLPLAIACLGWGSRIGGMAALVATAAIWLGLGWPAAIAAILAVTLPVPVACHLLGLARRTDDGTAEGTVEWYPVGRALMVLAILVATGTIVGGLAVGFDVDEVARETTAAARQMMGAAGDDAQIEPLIHMTVRLMPFVFPASWLMVSIFDIWLAARIVAKSGRLARPREDLAQVAVPATAGVVFAAGLAAMMLGGGIGAIAAVIAGVLFAVHFLVGMAVLHVATRGSGMRIIILAFVYGLILLFTVPALLVALAGLLEPHFAVRRRGRPPTAS